MLHGWHAAVTFIVNRVVANQGFSIKKIQNGRVSSSKLRLRQ